MDSNLYSKQNSISTYNKPTYSVNELLKKIYIDCALYPTTYAYLSSNNITFNTTGIKKTLINSSAELINPCMGFNHTFEHLLNMIYYLVKEGHFTMIDLEHTDWYFANLLFEKLYDEIEQKRKHDEEQNKQQEQEMARYQQMQDYQSRMMESMNNYMPNNFTNFN